MIDHPQFDNPRLRELARKLKDIPGIIQIRFYPLSNPELIEEFGEDTYYFALIALKHPDDTIHKKNIVEFSQFVTFATYNEPYYHTACVERFTAMVNLYNEQPNVDKSQLTQLAWQPTIPWEQTQ